MYIIYYMYIIYSYINFINIIYFGIWLYQSCIISYSYHIILYHLCNLSCMLMSITYISKTIYLTIYDIFLHQVQAKPIGININHVSVINRNQSHYISQVIWLSNKKYSLHVNRCIISYQSIFLCLLFHIIWDYTKKFI